MATTQIKDLAMYVQFKVVVTADEEPTRWSAHGWDRVDYMIATNAGEPLKPLEEIASGGEMSRVMLALKVTVEENFATGVGRAKRPKKTGAAALPTPRTLVFDEIDIGIGGRAAEAVGRKLKTLSKRQQVVCITHLPQIAAFADQHFLIGKSDEGGRTFTRVRRLEEPERESEIARMLSGAKLTEASVENARQLIESSR
jgi:DNA repair protein RecN (Recombination protein N)